MPTQLLFLYRSGKSSIYSSLKPKTVFSFLLIIATMISVAQPQKTNDLFKAIRSGDSHKLDDQLKNGANANDSLNGYSALMGAVLSGSADQMKILIDHGADVNFIAQSGVTALWLAVPDSEKTKLLLDKGADATHKVQGFGILVKL